MTGFGRAKCQTALGQFSIEIKTVNHRYSNVSLKLPSGLSFLEPRLQERIKEQIHRGQVYVAIEYTASESVATAEVRLNKALAVRYWRSLMDLREELGVAEPLKLEALLQIPGVLMTSEQLPDEHAMWQCLSPVWDMALGELQEMQHREGQAIKANLQNISSKIRTYLHHIHTTNEKLIPELRQKLLERMRELLVEVGEFDETRLMMEVGLLADKADVTEEISRLHSHCEQFELAMNTDGPVGRQLDFLLQEMNREANTIASKNRDQDAATLMVQMKAEIEKMRELVQNVA